MQVPVEFKTTEKANYTLVEFELARPLEPRDLPHILAKAPQVTGAKGVVLSGRGPVWLFGALVHEYHPTLWIATFDPRVEGAVVVSSHIADVSVGDVIKVDSE